MGAMIRVRVDDDETCWAEDLGDGKARIDNIPLYGEFNIDDVVVVLKGIGRSLPIVVEVVAKVFKKKVFVFYDSVSQFEKLKEVLLRLGCKVEGYREPRGATARGMMAVAAQDNVDVFEKAREVGIDFPEHIRATGRIK